MEARASRPPRPAGTAEHEFKVRHLLGASDCESLRLEELLGLADAAGLELWRSLALGYTESAGHPLLRTEVAGLYQAVAPDDVLSVVPEEGIFLAVHAAAAPGDQVVALVPAYQSLVEVARAAGCDVTPWPLRPGPSGWRLDPDELTRMVTDRTRLLVLNFPHNPTGYSPSRGELSAIVEIARQHGIWVLSDEMYRLLEHSPEERLPAVCDLYERGISLSGLSKSFGLPGLRVGWLASRAGDLLRRCQQLKDYTTICGSAPSEILAIVALRARQAIVGRCLEVVRANLLRAEAFFAARAELFRWLPPRAGSVAFPEWRGGLALDELRRRALASGVMVVTGDFFESPGSHFRVGLGRRGFPEALAAFASCLP
jgi:aspartate/methionine/tyrosine aminotransferase